MALTGNPATPGVCKVPGLDGCMDPDAFNYDPAASFQNATTCTPKIYGCMDKRAINYNSAANTYDSLSNESSQLCHGAYCVSAASCQSIFSGAPASCTATNSSNNAHVSACNGVTELSNGTACGNVAGNPCQYIAAGGPPSFVSVCGAVDSSFSDGDDLYNRVTACEAAGYDIVGPDEPESNADPQGLVSGFATVCRYVPSVSALCSHSQGGYGLLQYVRRQPTERCGLE